MAATITLREPRAFYLELSTLIGGGGIVCGIAVSLLTALTGANGVMMEAMGFGAIVGLTANLRAPSSPSATLRLGLGVLGGVVMASLFPLSALVAAAVGGTLIGAALSLDEQGGALRLVRRALPYGVCLAAAVFTTQTLFQHGFLQVADVPMAGTVLRLGIWGMFMGLAAGGRRLRWNSDAMDDEFRDLLRDADAEERVLLDGARAHYARTMEEIGHAEPGVRDRARQMAMDIFHGLLAATRRRHELARVTQIGARRSERERLAALEDRIHAAGDDGVRRELEAVRDALLQQQDARQRVLVTSARLEARQQRCVTALEHLHVAVVQARASAANDVPLQAALDNLEQLSEEMSWRDLSVDQLCDDTRERPESTNVPAADTALDASDQHAQVEGVNHRPEAPTNPAPPEPDPMQEPSHGEHAFGE